MLHGDMFDDAYAHARELALEKGYVFVHPFDDPQIISGAGTVALEMLEEAPELDTIVVPIGGGGLMSGVSIASRAIKPDIELIGVEAELYPSMKCAIQGCHMPLGGDTLAEGIAVKHPGELTSRILKDYANDVVLVPERDLERAVAMLSGSRRRSSRGRGRPDWRQCSTIRAVPRQKGRDNFVRWQYRHHLLANVLVRDLVRGRTYRAAPGRRRGPPGALAAITAKVHEAGVNIIEIRHSRIFRRCRPRTR